MKNVRTNFSWWICGILAAVFGVLVTRGIAPRAAEEIRIYLTATGQFIALLGLFIICLGVRRRLKREGLP